MSKPNATLLKLAAAVAQRQAQHAQAAQQQAQAAQAVTQDMVRQLAVDMVRELRDNAIPAIDKRDGAQLVREAFTIENMVRGVFQELKDELRGADGKNVTTDEAEALVRAVFAEIEPQLRGRDGDNATPDMVATAVSTFEVWKITDATDPDDYATGELLDTVGIGKYRFLSASGYKMVIRDTTTNFRVVSEMEKGTYNAALFFGPDVQLAQAPTVELIYTLLQTMDIDMDKVIANQGVINTGVRKASLLVPHGGTVQA